MCENRERVKKIKRESERKREKLIVKIEEEQKE